MYEKAWLVYIVTSVLFCGAFWYLTRNITFVIGQRLLRFFVAVLLLTPAYSVVGGDQLAPAYIVLIFSQLNGDPELLRLGSKPLLVGWALAAVVIIVGYAGQQIGQKRSDSVSKE